MNTKTQTKINNGAREVVQIAVMAAMIFAAKFALAFLPNIEVVTLLCAVFGYTFGRKGLAAAIIFVLCDAAYQQFGAWIISYLIYWPLVSSCFWLLSILTKNTSEKATRKQNNIRQASQNINQTTNQNKNHNANQILNQNKNYNDSQTTKKPSGKEVVAVLKKYLPPTLVALALTAFFGVLSSSIDIAIYMGINPNYFLNLAAYYLSGIQFYLIQITCNLIVFPLAFHPLVDILQKYKR